MATYEDKWFEIWYTDGVDIVPSHLLIVTSKPEGRSRVNYLHNFGLCQLFGASNTNG